jgi:hypothetical protein
VEVRGLYEYKFVTLEFKPHSKRPKYHEVIETHAVEGWRFVQIFAPTFQPIIGTSNKEKFYELIFEREKASS